MVQGKELQKEESLWLLSTLSELHSKGFLRRGAPHLIKICLEILLEPAPKWYYRTPDHVLLEAVVTLAAISCSPSAASRRNIITSSREHPWLLLNIRNPALFANWFEDMPSDCHKSLISLLFLIVYALLNRGSYPLAVEYLMIIRAKGDLCLHTPALTAVAAVMDNSGLSAIGRMLVAQGQELTSITHGSICVSRLFAPAQEELLKNYDDRLEASENLEPNFFSIPLILSKHMSAPIARSLQKLNLKLKNPSMRLAARVVALHVLTFQMDPVC